MAVDDVGSLLIWDDVTVAEDAWVETLVAASSVSDGVVRSQSGRIMQNTLTDTASAGPETSTYTFDVAGRLVTVTELHALSVYLPISREVALEVAQPKSTRASS